MFFTIILGVICVVCFLASIVLFAFVKTNILRINFFVFAVAFFILGNAIIIPAIREKYGSKETEEIVCADEMVDTSAENWNNVPIEPEVPNHDHKGVAPLSLYVTDGADVSETYYVEATDHDTYKFCYFHDDGSHIVKKEVAADKIKFEFSNDDLPHRLEVLLKDEKPVLYTLYLPEDSNTIQFDSDNK